MYRSFFIYILASNRKVLYVGVTNNLERRVWEHKEGNIPGFTSRYQVKHLVHFEQTSDVTAAIAREKQIKGWSRAKKIALIETTNPEWKDLSLDWYEKPDSSLRSE